MEDSLKKQLVRSITNLCNVSLKERLHAAVAVTKKPSLIPVCAAFTKEEDLVEFVKQLTQGKKCSSFTIHSQTLRRKAQGRS